MCFDRGGNRYGAALCGYNGGGLEDLTLRKVRLTGWMTGRMAGGGDEDGDGRLQ